MNPTRRACLRALAAGGTLALGGCGFAWDEGWFNACKATLPDALASDPLVVNAWRGIDPSAFVDVHCHLFGNGDSGSGVWVNPSLESVLAPAQRLRRLFYLNAGCVHDHPGRVDESVVDRLRNQAEGLAPGAKLMLLAFDWARDEAGMPLRGASTFHVPDEYAARVVAQAPASFEWAASVHPHDPAALDRLERVSALGARAVKWLPAAQHIDPASPRCDAFYRRLAALRLPLITHAGEERAITGHDETLGNPLKLRRALDQGVRVIVAHCGSLGSSRDLDRGEAGPFVSTFSLFPRLMDDARYTGRLFGDLSVVTLANRSVEVVRTLLARTDWHPRLPYGSDYPLPGVLPMVALDTFVSKGMLPADAVPMLRSLRDHNAVLFDFVLKRTLRSSPDGTPFGVEAFHTRRVLA